MIISLLVFNCGFTGLGMPLGSGLDDNTRKLLEAEVVSDCSPGTSNKPEDEILSKEPAEHRENEKAVLYTEEPPADKSTGILHLYRVYLIEQFSSYGKLKFFVFALVMLYFTL